MALKEEELQAKLKELTAEIVSDLSALDAAHSKELLGDFVSDQIGRASCRERV